MHAHLGGADGVLDIASGVTTVRDVGNDPDKLDEFKQRFDDGAAIGPHIVRLGFIEGRNEKAAASKVTAETADEAKAAVEFFAERGYEGVKIYNSVKPELVPVIAKVAHARGMQVIGHVPVHMLAHEAVPPATTASSTSTCCSSTSSRRRRPTRATPRGSRSSATRPRASISRASRCASSSRCCGARRRSSTPTVGAFEDLFVGEPGKITPGLEPVARLPVQTQRGFLHGGLPIPPDKRRTYRASWDKLLAMVKALHDARIPVVLGTDHIAGLMLHHEMALFARAGIPNAEILADGHDRRRARDAPRQEDRHDRARQARRPRRRRRRSARRHGRDRRVTQTMRAGVVFPSAPLYEAVGVLPIESGAGK